MLGNYPDLTLAEARVKHRDARALVAKKISPAGEKKRQEDVEQSAGTVSSGPFLEVFRLTLTAPSFGAGDEVVGVNGYCNNR